MRRPQGARIAALVIAALIPVTFLVPAVAAPSVGSFPAAIEGYAAYQGQTTCSPTAKPGVVRFRDLVLRTYPKTRNLGIVRGCNVGGRSEHKEGRAWDWGVSAAKPAEAAAVDDLMKWLFATDSKGNRHAIARRLGLQYVIWNRKIWGAYNSSGWRPYTGVSPHNEHVHFSFGRPGAEARTSFFSGRVAPVTPAPQAETIHPEVGEGDSKTAVSTEPQPPSYLAQSATELVDETVRLNVRDPRGTSSRGAMRAGEKYLLEVWGVYNWGAGQADAECSVAKGSSNWVRDRSIEPQQRRADNLDLYINGQDLLARSDDGSRCDARTHVYRWMYEAERTGRANFRIWDPKPADNSGGLSIRVIKVRDVVDQTIRVDSRNLTGATTSGSLRKNTEYVVTATGTYSYGPGQADAECSADAAGEWSRDRSLTRGDEDHLDLYVSGRDMLAKPTIDTGDQCDTRTHTYVWRFKPDSTSPVNVRVWDVNYADNRGVLTVRFTRADKYVAPATQSAPVVRPSTTAVPTPGSVSGVTPPTAAPKPSPTTATPKPTATTAAPKPSPSNAALPPATGTETVSVDAARPAGAATAYSYTAGVQYVLEASGTYWWGKGEADAECVRLQNESYWRRSSDRWTMPGTGVPLFDVTVNGAVLDWQAVRGGDCDTDGHSYRMTFVPQKTGPIVLAVLDSYSADNRGVISVTLRRA